jgi:hypothetical protein
MGPIMVALTSRLHINATVAAKVIDGEAVLINLDNGMYYSADNVGGFVWSLIERRCSLDEIAKAICATYDVKIEDAQSDLREVSAYLLEENLVTFDEETENLDNQSEFPQAEALKAYEQPRFEKYDDMAELFALDPPLPQLANPPMRAPGG